MQSTFSRQSLKHAVAIFVFAGRSTHRTSQRSATAQPSDCRRGVRGASAIDDKESLGLNFAVGLREFVNAKHLIEHDDASAQDARCALS
jgi:hypothetical protein